MEEFKTIGEIASCDLNSKRRGEGTLVALEEARLRRDETGYGLPFVSVSLTWGRLRARLSVEELVELHRAAAAVLGPALDRNNSLQEERERLRAERERRRNSRPTGTMPPRVGKTARKREAGHDPAAKKRGKAARSRAERAALKGRGGSR